ncbi:MAG TPA: YdcF family protein [Gemmatimonadaceae bacterium]|nr:YdcF family protein [Gemmatimonadaceae bacterium]
MLWLAAGIIALLSLTIAYTPLVSSLAKPMVRRDPIPPRVDAIAVLSMGFTPNGMMRSESLDRLLTGLTLAKRGVASTLLISRERRAFDGRIVSDSADQEAILSLAKPSAQVIFVDSVFTTRTEALRMKTIARARGWSSIAVVTSPMHTRRACATFESVGFKVVCVPAAVRESGLYEGSNAQDRLRAFRSWLYETFASDSYRRRGWIR